MKRKLKRTLSLVLFAIVATYLFANITYLFRDTYRRDTFLSYAEEDPDSIDVVMIGPSHVYRYFDTMRAWKEYGFTSFDYSHDGIPAGITISAIREIYKTQHPKVVAVNVCKFVQWQYEMNGWYRVYTDSIPFSMNRASAIYCYAKLNHIPFKDAILSYMDLIYYHNNWDNLKKPDNWKLIDNKTDGVITPNYFKGYWPFDRVLRYFDYEIPESKDEKELLPEAEESYRDLLQFATDHNIPLLLFSVPYLLNENEAMEINTLQQIAKEYGVPFLNASTKEAWEEMGLDLLEDFSDSSHLNVLGDQKYTDYICDYLVSNYDLPDKREDEAYSSWNKLYEESYLPSIISCKENAMEKVNSYAKAIEYEKKMPSMSDCVEWLEASDDSNITLLMCVQQPMPYLSSESKMILRSYGMQQYLMGANSFIGVYSGSLLYSDIERTEYADSLNSTVSDKEITTPFTIKVGDKASIQLGDDEYFPIDKSGIYILAVDNHSGKVIDEVSIQATRNGDLVLKR